MSKKTYNVNNRKIIISNLDKIFFPEINISKQDIIEYYSKISSIMIPHTRDRLLNMHRAPDGVKGENFYQQEISDYFPKWIARVEVEKREGGKITHALCNNKETLIYLSGQAVITFHTWLSRAQLLEKPDKLIFDLDPPPSKDFNSVVYGALKLKEYFDQKSVKSYIMTTGSKGLHVVVPLKPEKEFSEVRKKAKNIAAKLAEKYPQELTTKQHKDKRGGRLFLDYLRNSYGQTSVSPYSLRIMPRAPIATPLDWDELKNKSLESQTYNIKNIFKRLGQKEDPWKDFFKNQSDIEIFN
ncbi:MAG: non-homologous end-joining DNA ligase [Candidatus Humimicrobiaceae bacterium]